MQEEAPLPTRRETALGAAGKWSAVPGEVVKTGTGCAAQYPPTPPCLGGWCFHITISSNEGRSGTVLGRESVTMKATFRNGRLHGYEIFLK